MKMPSGFVTIIHENKTSIELEQKELITCRDCKHCEVITIFGKDFPACTLRKPAADVGMDDYCSRAEKKEYESVDEGNQG